MASTPDEREWLRLVFGPKDWWTCDYPERPPDTDAHFHADSCRPCVIALQMAGRRMGLDARMTNRATNKTVTIEEALEYMAKEQ